MLKKQLVSIFKRRERASRNGSTVVKIFIPPPSFKPVSLSLSRSPLFKTPKQVFFNPIHIWTLLPHFFSYYYYKFTFFHFNVNFFQFLLPGPLWKEILQMEIVDITTETARIRMYQCGQAKTDSRCVGELNIPLPLVRVLYPKEQEKTSEKKKPILSSNDIKHEIDQSLREAMSKDDLLNSIDVASIPKPQWMPLIYSWDNFTAHNGDLLLSMWYVENSKIEI